MQRKITMFARGCIRNATRSLFTHSCSFLRRNFLCEINIMLSRVKNKELVSIFTLYKHTRICICIANEQDTQLCWPFSPPFVLRRTKKANSNNKEITSEYNYYVENGRVFVLVATRQLIYILNLYSWHVMVVFGLSAIFFFFARLYTRLFFCCCCCCSLIHFCAMSVSCSHLMS